MPGDRVLAINNVGLAAGQNGVQGMVDQVKAAIIKSSASGKIGDGKIFISPIDEVVRIRTGETNEDAL